MSKTVPGTNDKSNASGAAFDYIVVCTKNIPDVPPTVAEIIAPAVTPGHTVIVLVQNGLGIEEAIFAAFPQNICISGIARMSSTELAAGVVFQQSHDILVIGAFHNPQLAVADENAAARAFADIYNASGKVEGQYGEDVAFMRWRKLIYNSSFNAICAITGMDVTRLRTAGFPIDSLIMPIMMEIKQIARASGVRLLPDQEEQLLVSDDIDGYFRPSMQQDIEKGNFMEFEIIVGAPLRVAQRLGVPAPNLQSAYSLLKALQTRTKMARGLVTLPPPKVYSGEATEMLTKMKASLV